jgi:hypothetical protein
MDTRRCLHHPVLEIRGAALEKSHPFEKNRRRLSRVFVLVLFRVVEVHGKAKEGINVCVGV